MSLYEHVIITRPDISSNQVEELVADTIRKFENLGEIEAPASAVHEIERQHRINEDILRYMTVRVEEFSENPSPILAKREERKRRDKRD